MNNLLFEILVLLFYFLGIAAALHALFRKGDPRSALIWVCVCLFIPFFGAILYILFGVNRVKFISQKWRSFGLYQFQFNKPEIPHVDFDTTKLSATMQDLTEVGNKLLQSKITSGCNIIPLFDGTQAYPAMLTAINDAKEHIYLSTYIFGCTGIGKEFIEALGAAVKRGVDVKVLIDGVGTLYTWPSARKRLKDLKVSAQVFLPILGSSINDLRYLNLRSHAKILVVDGSIGFTGGMNIHESNRATTDETAKIHDLHFRVEGPIVRDLQDAFLRNWYFNSKKLPRDQLYYDDRSKGDMGVRAVTSGPYQDQPIAQFILVAAINAAKHNVRIMTPYFIIGSTLSTALIEASLRGVNVELILPESNNLSFVKGATEALLPNLLNFGVKIYYRSGHFAHSKLFMVDDSYVFLGSSNMDTRSFYLNFEFNLEVYSKDLSMQLIKHFNEIKKISREITCQWLQKQNFVIKLRNSICKLFSPYL